jgi:predicted nucleic acid-binding protein
LSTIVLDASVLGPWFWSTSDPTRDALLRDFQAGRLVVHVPRSLFLEVLNVTGRQLRWKEGLLEELVDRMQRSRLQVEDPELSLVARWVSRGLTAYDASYVALAVQLGVPLVTVDRAILDVAGEIAIRPERFS